ncbi:hypothetical protein B0H13DRAFT_1863157 [Mycena leptocephala]|nr:hypothetical protein B0H13DRAFT_1863157 [Mycena leptocephala]
MRVFRNKTAVQERSLNITTESHNNISVYIRDRLATTRQAHPDLNPIWPGDQTVRQLISLSGNLFIWAATALDFVEGKRSFQPHTRLQTLLETPDIEHGRSTEDGWSTCSTHNKRNAARTCNSRSGERVFQANSRELIYVYCNEGATEIWAHGAQPIPRSELTVVVAVIPTSAFGTQPSKVLVVVCDDAQQNIG